MKINIDAVHIATDIQDCVSLQDIQQATLQNEHM